MKDPIGDRMKSHYENRTRYFLPRRTFTIIRLDGKAFHTFTNGLNRPFDESFTDWMTQTTQLLCKEIQGVKFGYVQSDEISLVLTDFDTITTDAWFDGNIQKIASVSASIATAWFNKFNETEKIAYFDSRVFTIPHEDEVINYFIWRQKDCIRNSISSVAQSMFSQKELHGKSTDAMISMIENEDGYANWNEYDAGFRFGRLITKERKEYKRWVTLDGEDVQRTYTRNEWTSNSAPSFMDSKQEMRKLMTGNQNQLL